MDASLDEIVRASVTQTGGIEDIIKVTVAKAIQELRNENDALKEDLNAAKEKIEWMDKIIQYAEDDKEKALKAQRDLFCGIGGDGFRLALEAYDNKEASHHHEIARLENWLMPKPAPVSEEDSQTSDSTVEQRPKAVETKVPGAMATQASEDVAAQTPDALTSEALYAIDMQLMWAKDAQAWVNSLPDFSSYPPEPIESYPESLPSMAESKSPIDQSKTITVPKKLHHTASRPQLPAPGHNRSYTLDPAAPGSVADHAVFMGPKIDFNGLGPTRALAQVMDFSRYKSPFFCQDCGEQFKVEWIGSYDVHRAKCQGKKKDAAVETGDLKAIGLARRNTLTYGPGPGNAFHGRSMPNLHGTLTKVGLHNGTSRLPPLELPPFKFPASKSPSQADDSGSSGSPPQD